MSGKLNEFFKEIISQQNICSEESKHLKDLFFFYFKVIWQINLLVMFDTYMEQTH